MICVVALEYQKLTLFLRTDFVFVWNIAEVPVRTEDFIHIMLWDHNFGGDVYDNMNELIAHTGIQLKSVLKGQFTGGVIGVPLETPAGLDKALAYDIDDTRVFMEVGFKSTGPLKMKGRGDGGRKAPKGMGNPAAAPAGPTFEDFEDEDEDVFTPAAPRPKKAAAQSGERNQASTKVEKAGSVNPEQCTTVISGLLSRGFSDDGVRVACTVARCSKLPNLQGYTINPAVEIRLVNGEGNPVDGPFKSQYCGGRETTCSEQSVINFGTVLD